MSENKKSLFPFPESIQIRQDLPALSIEAALGQIWPLLTEERRKKINEVVGLRSFKVCTVVENIYDRGNLSAVIRSAEALGLPMFHHIELGEKFKAANRVTSGSEKWIELRKWGSVKDCVSFLKAEGRQVVVTALSPKSVPIDQVDFCKPTALVLGNEKEGVSQEMIEAADILVKLPMLGFVQSYNISVAGALSLYHIYQDRMRRQGHHGDLSLEEQEVLKLIYALRTQDSGWQILERFLEKRSL